MYEDVTDFHNLLEAGVRCCNGGRWKAATQNFEINILQRTAMNKKMLESGTFRPKKTNDFTLCERGKERMIRAHHINDRQVYKSFVRNELIPATDCMVMEYNSASQPGKGTEHAIKAFRRALTKAYKKYGRNFFVWTYDFTNYFGSIPHEPAVEMSRLTDERSRWLLRQYSDLFAEGYGIGGEPSQRIAVIYTADLDGFVAAYPGVMCSGRYMDDGWAISSDRDVLKTLDAEFKARVEKKGLTVNAKRTNIADMSRQSVVFLKKRTSITETGRIVMKLSRTNVRDEIRRIKWQKAHDVPKETILDSFQCWCAYARKYQSDKQMLRVANFWSHEFGIPWEIALRYVNGGKNEYHQGIEGDPRTADTDRRHTEGNGVRTA